MIFNDHPASCILAQECRIRHEQEYNWRGANLVENFL
jgi:hypothetical protein